MVAFSPSGDDDIDGILWGYGWGGWSMNYSFPTSSVTYLDSGYDSVTGFEAFTADQQTAMLRILNNFDNVSGLEFTLGTGDTDLRFGEAASVDYGGIDSRGDHVPGNGTAEGNPPDPEEYNTYQFGDSWLKAGRYDQTPDVGGFAYAAGLMHELGHSVGLKHGHVSQTAHGVIFPALPTDHDSQEYTIMTYRGYPGAPTDEGTQQYPQTLMLNDISALQYMYSADYSYNSGADTYVWNTINGELFINGVSQNLATGDHILMTIWDGGGNDTYDFSNYTTDLQVNLAPGEWTTVSAAQLANLGPSGTSHPARGNIANARLYQGSFASLIESATGGSGSDVIRGNQAGNFLRGGGNTDTLLGEGGGDSLAGEAGNDLLIGGGGGDVLDGGAGIDQVAYFDSPVGVSVQVASGGTTFGSGGTAQGDTLISIESVNGSNHNDFLYGDATANAFRGLDGDDYFGASGGADSFEGGNGFDRVSYIGSGSGVNVFLQNGTANSGLAQGNTFSNIENITGSFSADNLFGNDAAGNELSGMNGADNLKGFGAADTLLGGDGDDRLKGGGGADVLNGGDGIDTASFAGSDAGVTVDLVAGTGAGGQAQGDNLNNIENLFGSDHEDTFLGDDLANTLNGAIGADNLVGRGGNDFFYVDNVGDTVNESAGEGAADRIFASVTYTLGVAVQVEIMSTTSNGGTDAINLTGNEFANAVYGNAGANSLNGAGGVDSLAGFGGNDFFFVDNAGDAITEIAGEGTGDRVFAAVSYALGAGDQVEIMSTTLNAGTGAINLTGNEFANAIYGNGGINTLDGRAGVDSLIGFGGNDRFFVDNAADAIFEGAGEGTGDRVFASVSYALGAGDQVEIMSTTNNGGTGAINLTGNEFVNTIFGNAGANTLDGRAGADSLIGFAGNDFFVVDNAGDAITEGSGQGTGDRVLASVSYTLGAGDQVEIMSTTNNGGTGAINLTGNEFANAIFGNAGSNVLNGKAGADTLAGFGGADFFLFDTALNAATNIDAISGFSVTEDTIRLENTIFTALGASGTLAAAAFRIGASAADTSDRIIYNSATGALIYDANGNAGGGATQFATLATALAMTNADFVVV